MYTVLTYMNRRVEPTDVILFGSDLDNAYWYARYQVEDNHALKAEVIDDETGEPVYQFVRK